MITNENIIGLNEKWEKHIKDSGADFVHFVDISTFSTEITDGCSCAIIFGKALSKEYLHAIHDHQEPKRKEVINTERKMDTLSEKLAVRLESDGYKAIGKLKVGRLPHKTIALRAGLGFIGKNNLLVNNEYGCALMLGKVITNAPFITKSEPPKEPQCAECNICVTACPTNALLGKGWTISTTREEIMVRKHCTLCLQCMVMCPYTEMYLK